MKYDDLLREYLALRGSAEDIMDEAKAKVSAIRKQMGLIEYAITEAAERDGLETVPAECGTGYWSVHYNCTIASPSDFFDFVREHEAWELMDKRANKTSVREYVERMGTPPPGVNFGGYRVFNVRENRPK